MRRCAPLLALLLVAVAPACRTSPPAGGAPSAEPRVSASAPVIASAGAAPVVSASASPSVSASPPEPAVTCNPACAAGTVCHLTKKGPACVDCAPGSAPVCKNDRAVATCGDDGKLELGTDCAAQKKRCDRGRCVARECTPKALHCFDGDVYRCNADGTARTLAARCVIEDPDGSLDASRGLCQVENGNAACRTKCSLPDHHVVALRDCKACLWEDVPFCQTEGPEQGCYDWICLPGGEMGFGALSIPCFRNTEGLTVPGSDKRGACEGTGTIGTRKITYDVCRGGQPAPATRVEPCLR